MESKEEIVAKFKSLHGESSQNLFFLEVLINIRDLLHALVDNQPKDTASKKSKDK